MTADLTPLNLYYRDTFARFGATHQGVGWADKRDVETARIAFEGHANAALGILARSPGFGLGGDAPKLLDFGCGWGALYQHLLKIGAPPVYYTGIDLSSDAIAHARTAFGAGTFECRDIREHPLEPDSFDYAIANGVFTCRLGIDEAEFWTFMAATVEDLFAASKVGVAWNVLSPCVDYRTDDWFHVEFDRMASFVSSLTRDFAFIQSTWPSYTIHAFR